VLRFEGKVVGMGGGATPGEARAAAVAGVRMVRRDADVRL
jgi:hypothetical protein